jgi:glycosyltransferase involved in cell wall biosynthesis/GT2 family glycosyltransferase
MAEVAKRPPMIRPLRMELVVPVGRAGGAELMMLELLDAVAGRIDVAATSFEDGPLADAFRDRRWPVTVLPVDRGPASILRASLALARRWRKGRLDLVLANGVKAAAVAVPAARLAGVRVTWFKHDFSYDARLARPLARWADAVLANSTEVAGATGRADVAIMPPPRPATPLPPSRARRALEQLGLPATDAPLAIGVGRLVAYKGFDDLIRALALPPAAGWHAALVGADDPRHPGEGERLRSLAEALGVGHRLTFLGPVPDAGRYLGGAQAAAVTTRQDASGFGREGFGRVALEAMVAGTPVLAAAGGPVAERLDGAGVLVAQGSPKEIADALARLSDPGVRRAMGRAGRRLARLHPDREVCGRILLSALGAAAGRAGAGESSGPPVSVVITSLDDGPALGKLLDDLAAMLGPEDEVVVVDGGSRDDTVSRVQAWSARDGRVRLVEAPGTNIPAGRNAGVREARHDVVAFTDAGCIPAEGWLEALRAAMGGDPRPDLVTGTYRPVARSAFERAMAAACYPRIEEARRPGPLVRAYGRVFGLMFDPSMPTGRSMAFTRAAWATAGGFPEDLDAGEDVVFGRRITSRGGRAVLAADAEVAWRQRGSPLDTARMYWRYGRGGGRSGNRLVVGRDLLRAGAYLAGPVVLAAGGRTGRRAVAAGALAYVSLPLLRARRDGPPAAVALVPPALALKDLAKAAGCIRGLLDRRSARPAPGRAEASAPAEAEP